VTQILRGSKTEWPEKMLTGQKHPDSPKPAFAACFSDHSRLRLSPILQILSARLGRLKNYVHKIFL
jgi:hypothetical protein